MSLNARGRAASDEVSWHNQPGKNKGLLESLTKCKKRNLVIYPVILTTSRLVSNAYLKGIMMDIKTVVTPLHISLSFSQPVSLRHSSGSSMIPYKDLVSSKFAV